MRKFKHYKSSVNCSGCMQEWQFAVMMKRQNPKWHVVLHVTENLHLFVEATYQKEMMLKEGRRAVGL